MIDKMNYDREAAISACRRLRAADCPQKTSRPRGRRRRACARAGGRARANERRALYALAATAPLARASGRPAMRSGCASVFSTKRSSGSSLAGLNSRYAYFSVSARRARPCLCRNFPCVKTLPYNQARGGRRRHRLSSMALGAAAEARGCRSGRATPGSGAAQQGAGGAQARRPGGAGGGPWQGGAAPAAGRAGRSGARRSRAPDSQKDSMQMGLGITGHPS